MKNNNALFVVDRLAVGLFILLAVSLFIAAYKANELEKALDQVEKLNRAAKLDKKLDSLQDRLRRIRDDARRFRESPASSSRDSNSSK